MKKIFIPFFLFILAAGMEAQTAGTLTVTATTSATATPSHGSMSDDAIWVQNGSGVFVKTLVGCISPDKNDLLTWKAASAYNIVDAVTSATRSNYGVRTGTWNGTNVSRVLVADGTYAVKMEMTDFSEQGSVAAFTFTKGPLAQTLTPANTGVFKSISITWQPVNSSVENVELSKLYTVYPNPTLNSIFITGIDIQEIKMCTLAGKSLMSTKEQRVNLSSFQKGIYLAVVRTKIGTIVKKVEKL